MFVKMDVLDICYTNPAKLCHIQMIISWKFDVQEIVVSSVGHFEK